MYHHLKHIYSHNFHCLLCLRIPFISQYYTFQTFILPSPMLSSNQIRILNSFKTIIFTIISAFLFQTLSRSLLQQNTNPQQPSSNRFENVGTVSLIMVAVLLGGLVLTLIMAKILARYLRDYGAEWANEDSNAPLTPSKIQYIDTKLQQLPTIIVSMDMLSGKKRGNVDTNVNEAQ